MPAEFMSAIAFLMGALVAMIASCQAVSKGARLQQEILKHGMPAQGRVLRIWRPPLLGAFTRVYFEFELGHSPSRGLQPVTDQANAGQLSLAAAIGEPAENVRKMVRGCHIDRRRAGELVASLPAVGSSVAVRYLPHRPSQAVIARLVSRISHG